jgi:hypothetical protein
MKRRLFLGGMLAAPAIVRADSLMKIIAPTKDRLAHIESFGHYMYDLNMQARIYYTPPSCIVIPDYMMQDARRILNAEFDKLYASTMAKR